MNEPFEVTDLLKALENNDNESIISKNLTSDRIEEIKNNVFNDIGIDDELKNDFKNKLKDYIYVDGISELIEGSYIRWIPLSNPERIYLTRGGNICDINITEKGTSVVVKNLRNNYDLLIGIFLMMFIQNLTNDLIYSPDVSIYFWLIPMYFVKKLIRI